MRGGVPPEKRKAVMTPHNTPNKAPSWSTWLTYKSPMMFSTFQMNSEMMLGLKADRCATTWPGNSSGASMMHTA